MNIYNLRRNPRSLKMNNATAGYTALAFLSLVLCAMVDLTESKRQCDENGQCKFGGWCDTATNTCRCKFECSSEEWSYTWHCGPVKNGRRMYFKNLCHLRAYACEHQENVAIVRIDFSKHPSKMCEPATIEPEVLCTQPQDFMGRCGSFVGPLGNLKAGICLESPASQKRCQCPSSKDGYDCETRIKVRSVSNPKPEDRLVDGSLSDIVEGSEDDRVARIALFAAVAFVALAACFALFVRRHTSCRRIPIGEENHPIEFKAIPHNLADARSDASRQLATTPPRERRLAERQSSRDDVSLNLEATNSAGEVPSNNNNNNSRHDSLALLAKSSDDVRVNLHNDVTIFDV